jgi:ribosomal protein S18 acetylase RimI-like enzyme
MSLTARDASEADKKFLYVLSCLAYEEIVVKQFGEWDDQWQRNYFEDKWNRKSYQVVEQDGRAIGALVVTERDDCIFLDEILLLPDYQDQGIGSTLLMIELDKARRKKKPMRLQVLKQNRARRLYERLGFHVYDQTDSHYLMEKALHN